jgi:hypothetical protein
LVLIFILSLGQRQRISTDTLYHGKRLKAKEKRTTIAKIGGVDTALRACISYYLFDRSIKAGGINGKNFYKRKENSMRERLFGS